MDGRLFVLSLSFIVLSVFMSVPQPGAGVQGSQDTIVADTHHDHVHLTEPRPNPGCEEGCEGESNQNIATATVNCINSQIRMELNASHKYMAMSAHFNRNDKAYRGFAKFFRKASDEEREHAMGLIDYLNKRGGIVTIKSIHGVEPIDDGFSPLDAVTHALDLEKEVNTALLNLHWDAQHKNDVHLQDFLESEYLTEQVDSIQELARWKAILTRLDGDALGIHQFDEELWHGSRG